MASLFTVTPVPTSLIWLASLASVSPSMPFIISPISFRKFTSPGWGPWSDIFFCLTAFLAYGVAELFLWAGLRTRPGADLEVDWDLEGD